MGRRNGAATRKQRMQEIAKEIHRLLQKHGEISLGKTVSFFAYALGLTKEKVLEYLRILEDLGHFVIDVEGDKIRKASES